MGTGTGTVTLSSNSTRLAGNLPVGDALIFGGDVQAHHLIPRAALSGNFVTLLHNAAALSKIDFDINDASNGEFLPTTTSAQSLGQANGVAAARHQGPHFQYSLFVTNVTEKMLSDYNIAIASGADPVVESRNLFLKLDNLKQFLSNGLKADAPNKLLFILHNQDDFLNNALDASNISAEDFSRSRLRELADKLDFINLPRIVVDPELGYKIVIKQDGLPDFTIGNYKIGGNIDLMKISKVGGIATILSVGLATASVAKAADDAGVDIDDIRVFVDYSNLAPLLSQINFEDIAKGVALDTALAAVSIAIGGPIAVAYNVYELVQSWTTLRAAVEFSSAIYGENSAIGELDGALDAIEGKLVDWFGEDFLNNSKDDLALDNSQSAELQALVAAETGIVEFPRTFTEFHEGLDQAITDLYENYCFPAGTGIVMADGTEKAIETLEIGDIVLAPNGLGDLEPKAVTKTFTNTTDSFVQIRFDDGRDDLFATPGHRFLTETGDYIGIEKLMRLGGGALRLIDQTGEIVSANAELVHYSIATAEMFQSSANRSITFAGNTVLKDRTDEGWSTFNFEVADNHAYVAGGIRVHNDSILGELEPNDIVLAVDYEMLNMAVLRDVDGDGDLDVVVLEGTRGQDGRPDTQVLAKNIYLDQGQTYSLSTGGNGNLADKVLDVLKQSYASTASQEVISGSDSDPWNNGGITDDFEELLFDDVVGVEGEEPATRGEVRALYSQTQAKLGDAVLDITGLTNAGDIVSSPDLVAAINSSGTSPTDAMEIAAWLLNVEVGTVAFAAMTSILGNIFDTAGSPTQNADNILGTSGDDTFNGLGGNDTIEALTGNDTLYGSSGNDTLKGGDGTDRLYGGSGNDRLEGGNGDDYLRDDGGLDHFIGGAGNDTASYFGRFSAEPVNSKTLEINLSTGVNNSGDTYDSIENLLGSDTQIDKLTGTNGANILNGAGGDDTLYGLSGNDTLKGGSGNDRLEGGNDRDLLYGGSGNDSLYGGAGDDYLRDDEGVDTFFGGSGSDQVSYYGRVESGVMVNFSTGDNTDGDKYFNIEDLMGTNDFGDLLIGDSGSNLISGLGGDDTIFGRGGNDNLVGGRGNDTLDGGYGNDSLYGNEGNDVIKSTSGSNFINGGAGDDTVYAGNGDDTVELGSGNDFILVGAGSESIDGGTGIDYISYVESANGIVIDLREDEVSGSRAFDDTIKNFESASGSNTGDDEMFGTDGANILMGHGGEDTLYGRGGADTLYGGDGDDRLDGGDGTETDFLYGGAGADYFVFDGESSRVIIEDFERGVDKILLTGGLTKADIDFSRKDGPGTSEERSNYYTKNEVGSTDWSNKLTIRTDSSWDARSLRPSDFLVEPAETDPPRNGDQPPEIEGQIGTDAAETIIDDGIDNIFAYGGDDRIVLSDGSSRHAWGGEGADHFVFDGESNNVRIRDFERGVDKIELAGGLTVNDIDFDRVDLSSGTNARYYTLDAQGNTNWNNKFYILTNGSWDARDLDENDFVPEPDSFA